MQQSRRGPEDVACKESTQKPEIDYRKIYLRLTTLPRPTCHGLKTAKVIGLTMRAAFLLPAADELSDRRDEVTHSLEILGPAVI
jgi:hypothetical protein